MATDISKSIVQVTRYRDSFGFLVRVAPRFCFPAGENTFLYVRYSLFNLLRSFKLKYLESGFLLIMIMLISS